MVLVDYREDGRRATEAVPVFHPVHRLTRLEGPFSLGGAAGELPHATLSLCPLARTA